MKGDVYGLSVSVLFSLFPRGRPGLFPSAPKAPEFLAAGMQLVFLPVRRAVILPVSADCGTGELPCRAGSGTAEEQGGAGGGPVPFYRGSCGIQISGIWPVAGNGDIGGGRTGLVAGSAQAAASGGHLLLLFHRHGLPHRRVPGEAAGGAELCQMRAVPLLFPLSALRPHWERAVAAASA